MGDLLHLQTHTKITVTTTTSNTTLPIVAPTAVGTRFDVEEGAVKGEVQQLMYAVIG